MLLGALMKLVDDLILLMQQYTNMQNAVDQGFVDQAQGFTDAQADRTAQFGAAQDDRTNQFSAAQRCIINWV